MPKHILIVANKGFETDPLVGVFTNPQARPADFPQLGNCPEIKVPLSSGGERKGRARLALSTPTSIAEVWCISDLMDPERHSSSSEEKARVLPFIIANRFVPDLVIAFGTGAYLDATSHNGSVVVGSRVFAHNPYRENPNPASDWHHPIIDVLPRDTSVGPISTVAYRMLGEFRQSIEYRLLAAALNPARNAVVMPAAGQVGITNVNVTNSNDYAWADEEAVHAFRAQDSRSAIGSLDTTHGVIDFTIPSQEFLYFSGITNRLGYFLTEVAPRQYAQHFVASHNAAVALAWVLPGLMA